MIKLRTGAAALGLFVPAVLASAPAAAAAADKPASTFVQCDGRTGHVSGGERFMRLLLVSATAGLSEAGMNRDDASKRATGVAGVGVCDQAIASEGDAYRRVQLGLARSLHLAEDKKWAEAAAAARAAPGLSTKVDWGLEKSSTSTARYLEAIFLIRAGQISQGEAAAWDGVRVAGPDVITLQRMTRFIFLSRTISPEKRAALEAMWRYYPDSGMRVASVLAESGDFVGAADAVHGIESTFNLFLKEPKPVSTPHSLLAIYAAMRGDVAGSKAELAIAKGALDKDREEGDAASEPTSFAAREEALAFAEAAIAQAGGDSVQAAKLLAARGSWSTIPGGVVARLVGQVAPNVPEKDRAGVVAKGDEALWKETLDARLALLRKTENDSKLWSVTGLLAQDVNYQRLAAQALTGSTAKPKWLVKPGKEPRSYDFISTVTTAPGWESGEGILYHAALIAKQRGKQGFVFLPKRDRIDWVALRFVNPGEYHLPAGSVIIADDVITSLSPHIRPAGN